MTDFIKAFNEGIEEASRLEVQITEINSVFEDLSEQIQKATDGKIRVTRLSKTEKVKSPEKEGGIVSASFNLDEILYGKEVIREKYMSINGELIVSSDDCSLEIARWETSNEGGYPCRILYAGNNIAVHDKASLEEALQALIRSATAGKVFKILLDKAKEHDEILESLDL